MNNITGEQVRKAMIKAGIAKFHLRDCSICKFPLFYVREGNILLYDNDCNCTTNWRRPLFRPWDTASELINMQTNKKSKKRMMKGFGLINGEIRESKMNEDNMITISIPFDSSDPCSEKACIHDCSSELWRFMKKHRKELFKGDIEIHMIIEKCTVMKDNLSFEFIIKNNEETK